jgi:hypothetical protein
MNINSIRDRAQGVDDGLLNRRSNLRAKYCGLVMTTLEPCCSWSDLAARTAMRH